MGNPAHDWGLKERLAALQRAYLRPRRAASPKPGDYPRAPRGHYSGPHPPDREASLLFERQRVELHEIGATALQREIRQAPGDLCGLTRVATEV